MPDPGEKNKGQTHTDWKKTVEFRVEDRFPMALCCIESERQHSEQLSPNNDAQCLDSKAADS